MAILNYIDSNANGTLYLYSSSPLYCEFGRPHSDLRSARVGNGDGSRDGGGGLVYMVLVFLVVLV